MGLIKNALKRKLEPQKMAIEEKVKEKIYDAVKPAEKFIDKVKPESERTLKREQFQVVGIYYHMGEIGDLAEFNPEYDLAPAELLKAGKAMQKVFRYKYNKKPVRLDQTDEGLRVVVNDKTIGSISSDDSQRVLDLIRHKEIKFISAYIYGGPYKVVSLNCDVVPMDDQPKAKITIGYI